MKWSLTKGTMVDTDRISSIGQHPKACLKPPLDKWKREYIQTIGSSPRAKLLPRPAETRRKVILLFARVVLLIEPRGRQSSGEMKGKIHPV